MFGANLPSKFDTADLQMFDPGTVIAANLAT
jgi:hypothetical protein